MISSVRVGELEQSKVSRAAVAGLVQAQEEFQEVLGSLRREEGQCEERCCAYTFTFTIFAITARSECTPVRCPRVSM